MFETMSLTSKFRMRVSANNRRLEFQKRLTSWPAVRWTFICITHSLFNSFSLLSSLCRSLLFIYLSVTTTKRPWLAVLIASSGTHSIVSDISLCLLFRSGP
ncbi:hypothetical protein BDV38DRAFT_219375 [Aspergillus pseudotamarii]|uniref:Uncharacterized protein n=1 Tax=Aspergillus pseudotamarii TaxID=132259 RepID=A0A5N6T412_ASPPS|nr:uncharacterized protein BDV38DRAFT_219375 [Aspergillus pseudotamarii]KAE8141046.1 hypothetical protein BDV38DRAFT_219375 [Aspergillus pseudotamarii]